MDGLVRFLKDQPFVRVISIILINQGALNVFTGFAFSYLRFITLVVICQEKFHIKWAESTNYMNFSHY